MVLQPDNQYRRTATDLIEQILARDATPQSATTLQRQEQDPTGRLGAAAARYLDALHLATEHLTDRQLAASVDITADRLLNGPSRELAWPTLGGQLPHPAVPSADPVPGLTADAIPEVTAGDQPAVIDCGSRPPASSASVARCRGCPAFPSASPPTPTGAHTYTPAHI